MKRPALKAYITAQDWFLGQIAKNMSVHRMLFAPGLEGYRWRMGRLRAWAVFEAAAEHVPAYREFLRQHGTPTRLADFAGLEPDFSAIPESDKASYIKRWTVQERCPGGRLPSHGVVVDESSGSSGSPTSWVRGRFERRAVQSLLQLGFRGTASRATKPVFILNAFSLGAWATGMNVSASLSDVAIIKSIGPDRDKIISTMREFGPHYTYLVTSYPPFLKELFDDDRLDWASYDVMAGFGGEGLSENMRSYLLRTASAVVGSYGASDLEINLAIETDFTIGLRRAVQDDPRLAERITRMGEYGVLPMIFQYNPYVYLMETNDRGELVVTITRRQNINPRIRYNIHDRGHVLRMRDLAPMLRELGHGGLLDALTTDLPVLFHYGRSDMSVDYNGAVLAPDEVRDIIHAHPLLVQHVHNHRLISFEDGETNKQLHIALQLEPGEGLPDGEEADLLGHVHAALLDRNRDFRQACRTAPARVLPTIHAYAYRTGPFTGDGAKLKNEYVWHLAADQVDDAALVLDNPLPSDLLQR